jgi:hypothetical protein
MAGFGVADDAPKNMLIGGVGDATLAVLGVAGVLAAAGQLHGAIEVLAESSGVALLEVCEMP